MAKGRPRNDDKLAFSIVEVADKIGVNERTVRRWIDRGDVKTFDVGGRPRITRGELERLLDEGHRGNR